MFEPLLNILLYVLNTIRYKMYFLELTLNNLRAEPIIYKISKALVILYIGMQ